MTRLALWRAVAVVVARGAIGCCLFDKGKEQPQAKQPEPATFSQYHLDGWEWERVDRILVLPFLNESQYTRAGDEARAAFTSELQRLGRFEVIAAAAGRPGGARHPDPPRRPVRRGRDARARELHEVRCGGSRNHHPVLTVPAPADRAGHPGGRSASGEGGRVGGRVVGHDGQLGRGAVPHLLPAADAPAPAGGAEQLRGRERRRLRGRPRARVAGAVPAVGVSRGGAGAARSADTTHCIVRQEIARPGRSRCGCGEPIDVRTGSAVAPPGKVE